MQWKQKEDLVWLFVCVGGQNSWQTWPFGIKSTKGKVCMSLNVTLNLLMWRIRRRFHSHKRLRRVPHRGSRDSSGSSWTGSSRQSSTETDCRYGNDPRPWSSTDSDSSHPWTSSTSKPCQAVSHSWDAQGSGSFF